MLGSSAHLRVRRGKPSDAEALAAVFRDSWQVAYRGIIPHLHLESMIRRRSPEWWASSIGCGDNILVLEIDRKVVGYATWGCARTRGPCQGEIYELYLTPTHQGLGFGEYLFEACRHAMDQRKLKGLICWALAENRAAIGFYWRRGGRPIAQSYENIGGERLEKIAFAWS
jgi:ribosomal protein S18 acetylase RimI-like enzyme